MENTNYYAVKIGVQPGIYTTWEECRANIDHYSGAKFKKCKTEDEAKAFMAEPETNNVINNMAINTSLSPEQQYAFNKYKLGQNLFITGPGGTGKSFLIKSIVKDMDAVGRPYSVCALTGCAAVLLNCCAKTIHSWAGIGIANASINKVVSDAVNNKYTVKRWQQIKTLIIDEVSMMSAKLLIILDRIGRATKRIAFRPFGGIQVICFGDFYQLPPISRVMDDEGADLFCFDTPLWNEIFPMDNQIQLTTYFRQTDERFIRILNEVRQGELSQSTVDLLTSRVKTPDTLIPPPKLYPRNADVDRINNMMFTKLAGEGYTYEATRMNALTKYEETGAPIPLDIMLRCNQLDPEIREAQMKAYIENRNIALKLELKKDAVVMCLANLNLDKGICNGSIGRITGFTEKQDPIVLFTNGLEVIIEKRIYQHDDYPKFGIEQVPLRLAWAFSINKSQGITLDIAEMDIGSRIFECGQTYVALSRVKTIDGLFLSGFNPYKIRTNPKVIDFYNSLPKNISESMMNTTQLLVDSLNPYEQPPEFKVVKLLG